MRVLIVEPEPLIALSLATELELAGHEVVGPSDDADEALGIASDQRIDLALIDAEIGGTLSGIELARLLSAQCDVPSLLLTTAPLSDQHVDAAIGMVSLPFDPSDIPHTVFAAARALRGDRITSHSLPNSLQLFAATDFNPARFQ